MATLSTPAVDVRSVSVVRQAAASMAARPVEVALLIVAPLLWMAPAWTSLWLDEGLTYWIIKDGPLEAIRRSAEYQGQSPLYFLIAWLSVMLGGHTEFALRVPSLIAIALTALVLHRLGRRLFDSETGVIAATLFAYWVYLVSNMPYNARPYALAVLAVAASTLALIRWLDSSELRDACAYIACAALVLYTQPLYAGVFGIHLVAVLERRWQGKTSFRVLNYLCALGVAIVITLPVVPQMVKFWRLHRAIYPSTPSLAAVGGQLWWPPAVILLLLLVRHRAIVRAPIFLYVWCIAPPVWLLAVTIVSGDVGPIGRYNYWQFPALVLALAIAIRTVSRPLRVGVLIVVALMAFNQTNRGALEDWRAAVGLARPLIPSSDTPILVRSGLPQARLTRWLEEPDRVKAVLAPLEFYPMPGTTRALPYDMDDDYLRRVIVPAVESHSRILLIAHDFKFETMQRLPLKEWFDAHLSSHRSREIARIYNIVVVVYDRM